MYVTFLNSLLSSSRGSNTKLFGTLRPRSSAAFLQPSGCSSGRAVGGAGSNGPGTSSPACCPPAPPPGEEDMSSDCCAATQARRVGVAVTHLQPLQGPGGHVGIPEVDESAETLVQNSDALYLTEPTTRKHTCNYSRAEWYTATTAHHDWN